MDNYAKQTVFETVLDMEQKLAGNHNYVVVTYFDPINQKQYFNNPNLNGAYANETIYMNSNSSKYNDFTYILGTITHEGVHAFQDYIVKNYAILEKNPELVKQRNIFEINNRNGMYADPKNGNIFYTNNPVEKDAWQAGNKFRNDIKNIKGR